METATALVRRDDLAQPSTFPVPPDSFGWYGLETDSRDGLPFRFFSGSAWLSLPPPQRQCNLRFIIPHVLMGEALPEVTLSVSGNPIPLDTTERDSFGRPIGIGSISPSTWKFLAKSLSVRVEFSCKYSALPKHLYADATDARKLSIAVSYPQYVDN
jgi:hypothetical protein